MEDTSKWLICYRQFIDAANFRFMSMEELVNKQVSRLNTTPLYTCPRCRHQFFKADQGSLFESAGMCTNCRQAKVEKAAAEQTGRSINKTTVLSELKKFRAQVMKINDEDPSKILQAETVTVTKGTDGVKKTVKVVEAVDAQNLYRQQSALVDDLFPIQIGADCLLIVPILTHENEEWGKGTQLAHDFLNLVAELKYYYSRVLVFEITKHSLYFARNRGLTPDYIVQMLQTLSLDKVPARLENLVRQEVLSDLTAGLPPLLPSHHRLEASAS